MRKLVMSLIAASFTLVLLPIAAFAHTVDAPLIRNLIAGQHDVVGTVSVWNDTDYLYVEYELTGAHFMTESHVEVALSLDGIPRTKKGNPIPGRFTYSDPHGLVNEYTYEIPCSWDAEDLLWIAAHAAIQGVGYEGCADFGQLNPGDSVEGPGTVYPDLDIDAVGLAVKVEEGVLPMVYGAPNVTGYPTNGCLSSDGGFSDYVTKVAKDAHHYTFTFTDGVSVSSFSLHMLDFGDYNPSGSEHHLATMTAYDALDNEVDQMTLEYNSPGVGNPKSSDLYGNLWYTGDACTADFGEPGNWTWYVAGENIVKVVLDFGDGHDPYIGFDTLCVKDETAWAAGERFMEHGNWATYFTYTVQ